MMQARCFREPCSPAVTLSKSVQKKRDLGGHYFSTFQVQPEMSRILCSCTGKIWGGVEENRFAREGADHSGRGATEKRITRIAFDFPPNMVLSPDPSPLLGAAVSHDLMHTGVSEMW